MPLHHRKNQDSLKSNSRPLAELASQAARHFCCDLLLGFKLVVDKICSDRHHDVSLAKHKRPGRECGEHLELRRKASVNLLLAVLAHAEHKGFIANSLYRPPKFRTASSALHQSASGAQGELSAFPCHLNGCGVHTLVGGSVRAEFSILVTGGAHDRGVRGFRHFFLRAKPQTAGWSVPAWLSSGVSLGAVRPLSWASFSARPLQARLLVAGALLERASALRAIDRTAEAKQAITEAQQIYDAVGDKWGVARSMMSLGVVLTSSAEDDAAQHLYLQCGELSKSLGMKKGYADALTNLSQIYGLRGQYARAQSICPPAISIYRSLNEKRQLARALRICGTTADALGQDSLAMSYFQEGISTDREIGDDSGTATLLINLGEMLANHGNLAQARANLEQSLAYLRRQGKHRTESFALFDLAEISKDEGDLRRARQLHEESMRLRTEIGLADSVEESRIALGKIALEEGRPDEALAAARRAAEAPGIKTDKEDSAEANALAARALLAMGKSSEAAELINTTEKLLPAVQDQVALLMDEMVLAQVGAAANRAGAERKLGTIVRRASRAGLAGVAMEARLAEAEIRLQRGESRGLRTLADLQKDAKARGYNLIAPKASADQRPDF